MNEHITHAIYYAGVHLIFCSMVWLSAWALTSLPGGSATAKHWIWAVTGLNFVLPLGAIVDTLFAHHISWASPIEAVGGLGVAVSESLPLAITLAALWAIGALAMLARLCARVTAAARSSFFFGACPR
jgi:hypothetical protein